MVADSPVGATCVDLGVRVGGSNGLHSRVPAPAGSAPPISRTQCMRTLERWNSFPPPDGVLTRQSLPLYTYHCKEQRAPAYRGTCLLHNPYRSSVTTPKISPGVHRITSRHNNLHLTIPLKPQPGKAVPGTPGSSWLHRPVLSRQHSLVTPLQLMTVGAKPGTSKPRGDMDFLSGDYSNGPLYDHTVSGEVNMMDSTIFASSPNSLYMYEQEKNDMQSFSDTSCNGSMTSLLNEEPFELKSQYENSCDISMPTSGGSTVTTTSNATGTFTDSSWVNNTGNQSSSSNLVKSEEFEPTLAELNTVTSEENTMMDISSLTDYISPENMQQLDLLLSAAQQSFTNGESSAVSELKQNSSDRGRSNSASEMSRTWTTTSPTQDNKPVFSGDIKPSYQRQTLSSQRLRHSSASSYSNKHPQKSTIESSQLHELLSRSIRPVTVTTMENSVATSTPSQLSPGKRKLAMFPEEESNSVDKKWEEIKQLLYPEEKHAHCRSKCKRQSLDSTSSAPSFEDSDSDSDVNDFSDSDSEGSQEEWNAGRSSRESRQHRKDQYFWQYNIQSKGPKGKRVKFGMEENPHKVQDFEDPVFDSSSASQLGTTIRHGGKARKGDGNDVSPNPKKLVQIGTQIKKLNKQINSFAPLSELPVSTRNKSKKEKNKLASRACRLKKKAQHEANKVKLYGLDIEHKQLLNVIDTIKEDLHNFIVKKGPQLKFSTRLQNLVKENLTIQVAGNTTEYVNTVIAKVEAGDPKGGLDSSKRSRVQNEHT